MYSKIRGTYAAVQDAEDRHYFWIKSRDQNLQNSSFYHKYWFLVICIKLGTQSVAKKDFNGFGLDLTAFKNSVCSQDTEAVVMGYHWIF